MKTSASTKDGKGRQAFETGKTIVYALLIALVLRIVLFQPFTIPSDSMEPALRQGDYIVVSKFSYGWSRCSLPFCPSLFHGRIGGKPPQRGDVIVFQLPRDESQTYIKRVIGLPGDRVQLVEGQVIVNGRPVPRVPIGPGVDPDMPQIPVVQYRETKPDGRTYVVLQHTPPGEEENTDVYVVPPGQYFFLGDNRDNSLDSRWPGSIGVGYVPAENIVGKAQFVLFSWSPGATLFQPWTWITHIQPRRFLRALA